MLFFGERCCMWHPPAQLLPFKRHLHEKLADGNELIAAKKIARPGLFKRAVQVPDPLIMCALVLSTSRVR